MVLAYVEPEKSLWDYKLLLRVYRLQRSLFIGFTDIKKAFNKVVWKKQFEIKKYKY